MTELETVAVGVGTTGVEVGVDPGMITVWVAVGIGVGIPGAVGETEKLFEHPTTDTERIKRAKRFFMSSSVFRLQLPRLF